VRLAFFIYFQALTRQAGNAAEAAAYMKFVITLVFAR
jgi:hypothetical protein